MRRAISSLAAAVALAASACTLTVTEQMVLPATRYGFDPLTDEVRRRNVVVQVAPDVTLRGWYLEKERAERVVLYFYGNGQHMLAAEPDIYGIAQHLEANVLCLDYRGYGFSGGQPSLEHAGQDALAAFDRLQALNRAGLPALVMGWSLGTGYATYVAANRDTAGAILLAPMTTAEEVAAHWNDRLPWFADIFFSFDVSPALRDLESQPGKVIDRVTEPLLVIHGTEDPVLPYDQGKALYERAPSRPKHLCTLEGVDHGLSFSRVPAVRRCVQEFLPRLESPRSVAHGRGRRAR